jgi:hypothetical protein
MLYFSNSPVHPDSVDSGQYAQLKAFKETCRSRGLYETYSDLADFRTKFYRHLQLRLNQDEYFKGTGSEDADQLVEAPPTTGLSLSKEATELLLAAAADPNGSILHARYIGGESIQVSGRNMIDDNSPRTKALWNAALQELEDNELVAAASPKREVYRVTRRGYEVADRLKK